MNQRRLLSKLIIVGLLAGLFAGTGAQAALAATYSNWVGYGSNGVAYHARSYIQNDSAPGSVGVHNRRLDQAAAPAGTLRASVRLLKGSGLCNSASAQNERSLVMLVVLVNANCGRTSYTGEGSASAYDPRTGRYNGVNVPRTAQLTLG